MLILGGVDGQKNWCVVNNHVIHMALHRAKQMMCLVRDVNCLVEVHVLLFACVRVGICDHTVDC